MDVLAETTSRPDLRPSVGLVLTGGGSRSAYQVGVLLALAELLPRSRNPFQVIVGTSAGAVAASVLAAEAHHWRRAVAGLERVWANFRSSQIFHVDAPHMLRAGAHWVLALVSGGMVLAPPKSMLDNTPAARAARGARGLRRYPPQHRARTFARLCAVLDQLQQRSVGRLLRRHRLHRRLVARAAHRAPHAIHPRSPDGERRDPAACSRRSKSARTISATARCASCTRLSPAIHLGADRLLIIGVRARRAAGWW